MSLQSTFPSSPSRRMPCRATAKKPSARQNRGAIEPARGQNGFRRTASIVTQPPSPTEATRHAVPPRLIHDLLTPLNQIIGYSEMLIEQAREQGQTDLVADLQKTHAAGKRLLSLIDDNFVSIGLPDTHAVIVALSEEYPAQIEQEPAAEAF